MKKNIIVIIFCVVCLYTVAHGQQGDSNPQPTFHWRCTVGDTLFNFNPATSVPQSFDTLLFAPDYTVIVVYKPLADTEATVWHLTFNDSISKTLTTRRIISGSTDIRYTDVFDRKPVIHTLRQSAPEIDTSYVQLVVGDGNLMVAEVMFFNYRISTAALRRIQSILAIRYGITLGPVDYFSGDGRRIWEYRSEGTNYHHRITGLGIDTVYNARQLCSQSEMEGGIVTILTDTLMPGTFLLLGDNDAPLSFEVRNDGAADSAYEILTRTWRVQATGTDNIIFSLAFDTRGFPSPTDSLVLLIDGDIYLPRSVSAASIVFDNLFFPTGTSFFTLAKGSNLWHSVRSRDMLGRRGCSHTSGSEEDRTHLIATGTSLNVYPNPTTERFTLEVRGTEWVNVTIYDTQGKIMATYNDNGRDNYLFDGILPSGNVYYATVSTADGNQTIKIIVK